jgi:hypothetical protein
MTNCKACQELRKDKLIPRWFCQECLRDMPAKVYPCQVCGSEWSTSSESLFNIGLEDGEMIDVRACRGCRG